MHKSWKNHFKAASKVNTAAAVEQEEVKESLKWFNHGEFRSKVIETVDKIMEIFPENANFNSYGIKLHTLAARYCVLDADSFDGTEVQVRKVAELLLKCTYMD